MLHSLTAIEHYREQRYPSVEHPPLWLTYLVSAEERIVNLERVTTLQELSNANPVLDYVERTLRILDQLRVSFWQKELIEEVLIWSETAKGGTVRERIRWQEQGINLFVHNEGSAELYLHASADPEQERTQLVSTLIRTHGLIGQCLRGEVPFAENLPLTDQVSHGILSPEEMKSTLLILNRCIIEAVSSDLWAKVQDHVLALIQPIVYHEQPIGWTTEDRILRLRTASIDKGENTAESLQQLNAHFPVVSSFERLQDQTFWYVEAALQDFSFEEFAKIFTWISHMLPEGVRHISFERLMNTMYYDYKGIKKVNVYKKRMIEKVLADWSWEQLSSGQWVQDSPHLHYECVQEAHIADTVFFNFVFSPAAEKLIEFCIEAEKSPLYEKAVLLLFDLFGLRRDAYDRFHNEESYLEMMNQTVDYKRILRQYIVGQTIIDIGPGGGVMLDLIEEEWSDKRAIGIDISENVIEALQRKKQLEGRSWEVQKGDALALRDIVEPGSVDSVLFSSILHELYSYIPFNGKKFNLETVAAALSSAYDVLSKGGRIIIRDGIMTEPVGQKRRIQFLQDDGLPTLQRYAQDFAGRSIQFEVIGEQEVLMPVNDAMEFLYTYTWGEEAYVHEVQEQFGYMTPSEYRAFIEQALGASATIVHVESFLQAGYTEALQDKVNIMDEWGESVPLPDSTCIIVIEKS